VYWKRTCCDCLGLHFGTLILDLFPCSAGALHSDPYRLSVRKPIKITIITRTMEETRLYHEDVAATEHFFRNPRFAQTLRPYSAQVCPAWC
jgi:hypothetical protein